jgi:hypothetical protein
MELPDFEISPYAFCPCCRGQGRHGDLSDVNFTACDWCNSGGLVTKVELEEWQAHEADRRLRAVLNIVHPCHYRHLPFP